MIYLDTDINGMDLCMALQQVSQQRREQALRYKHERDRRLSVAVFLLLKRALREEYGLDGNPELGYEEGGKPFIIGHPEIYFNFSHCRLAAACAVSDRPIGIDIEAIRPVSDALMHYVLSNEEYRAVAVSERPQVEFIKLWTMKESLLKMTGTGLRVDLPSLLPSPGVVFNTTVMGDFVYTVCQRER